MKPSPNAHQPYLEAFAQIVRRVAGKVAGAKNLPIRMYVAGGAALHLFTGARISADIDASFSARLIFAEDIQVSYRDADGRARLLYLDRNYSETLGLLHEDARKDSKVVEIPGVDAKVIEVRALSPVDLAVSKLGRFTDQDRSDIETLAKLRLIDERSLRSRAEEALRGYVGDERHVRTSIDLACNLVREARKKA